MIGPRSRVQTAGSFFAGALIGLSIVTPVFAATGSGPEQWHTFVMLGAIVLLIVGLMLEAVVHGDTRPGKSRRKAPKNAASHAIGSQAPPSVDMRRRPRVSLEGEMRRAEVVDTELVHH